MNKCINRKGLVCGFPDQGDGYCRYRRDQKGDTNMQFALPGLDTADVYETPLNVPLPLSQRLGGAKGVEKAREALEATQVPDPMKQRRINLRTGFWAD